MPQITVGTVTVVLPDNLEIDPRAGKLSDEEQLKILKARKGLGLACDLTAAAMEKSAGTFVVPGVDPEALRIRGDIAETFDQVIEDLEIVKRTIKQGNLLADELAFNDLRKINNQVKAQDDFEPAIRERFASVIEYFQRKKSSKEKVAE